MRLGIAISQADPWHFFNDIYEDLKIDYQLDVFKFQQKKYPVFYQRINQYKFHRYLLHFLEANDVVFFEWASDLLAAASHCSKICKIVTRLHRYELFEWASRIAWERVDKIILVSHAMRRKFSDMYPEYSERAVVIPVGVSTTKFQPFIKEFSGDIGILANLIPRKRVYDLILSFYDLYQINKALHLHIGGGEEPNSGDYFDALKSLVRKLGLQNSVTFDGKITEPQEWLHKIDIFISNSFSEGLQVAPMEAMASGCYCLSHHWDGAEDLLPEENLYLTNAQFIEKVLAYYDLPESLKQAKKAQMCSIANEKFDIEKVKQQIRGVIDGLGAVNKKLG